MELVKSISLHSDFLVGQSWRNAVLNHLVNHQHIQSSAETKNQALNRPIYRALGRLYSLILCG